MGITARTHTNAPFFPLIFFFTVLKRSEWMRQDGGGGGPGGDEHGARLVSSHSSPSAICFRLHSDFMTHFVSVGRNGVVSVAHTRSSCPPPDLESWRHLLIKLYSLHLITKWMARTSTWRVICLIWVAQIKTPSQGCRICLGCAARPGHGC